MGMGAGERTCLARLNEMALAVFSASSLEELSEAILAYLPNVVPHQKSMLIWDYFELKSHRMQKLFSNTVSPQDIERYDSEFIDHDYTAWYLNMPDVGAYRDSDLVSSEHMQEAPIFREWVRPMGMFHVGGVVFWSQGCRVGDVVLFRSEDKGDFTDDELFVLELVRQQIQTRFAQISHGFPGGVDEALDSLTKREREVALLVGTDMDMHEVAERLSISYGTVRKHVAAVYEKLGINTRVQLVRLIADVKREGEVS